MYCVCFRLLRVCVCVCTCNRIYSHSYIARRSPAPLRLLFNYLCSFLVDVYHTSNRRYNFSGLASPHQRYFRITFLPYRWMPFHFLQACSFLFFFKSSKFLIFGTRWNDYHHHFHTLSRTLLLNQRHTSHHQNFSPAFIYYLFGNTSESRIIISVFLVFIWTGNYLQQSTRVRVSPWESVLFDNAETKITKWSIPREE